MVAAAGQRVLVVVAAAHADELIDFVVIRSQVLIADRPGDLPSVAIRAGEIEIGVAQGNAAPNVGLPAAAPDAHQVEGLSRRSAIGSGLQVDVELRRLLARGKFLGDLPRLDVTPELGSRELGAGVQHQDAQTLPRQVPGRHAAGRSGADDDDVVDFGAFGSLH